MTDPKPFLQHLYKNLATLEERRAKYAGNAPLDLLNQIDDHHAAIDLTEQVIAGELTPDEWQTALLPLLISVAPFRAAQQIVLIIGSDTAEQSAADLSTAVLEHLRQTPTGAVIADEFAEDPQTYQKPVEKAVAQALVSDGDLAGQFRQLLVAYSAALKAGGITQTGGDRSIVGSNVDGDAFSGDHNRKVQAETYVEQQTVNHPPPPDPEEKRRRTARRRYLERLRTHCQALPLAALGGQAGDEKIKLDHLYIELETTTLKDGTEKEPTRSRAGGREDEKRLTALKGFIAAPHMALLGDPGSGKSTFVRKLLGWQAAALLDGTEATPCPPSLNRDLLPVQIILRDLAPRLAPLALESLPETEQRHALLEAVKAQVRDSLARLEAQAFSEEVIASLVEGRCLLVLDGLDEVPQDLRGRVRQAVGAIVREYEAPRLIVTCRIRSYTGAAVLDGFPSLTLAPFTEEKIEAFTRAWYEAQRAIGQVDAVEAADQAADLARAALGSERELAENPMLLTTMAIIHQQDTRLPPQRVLLYDRAVQILLYRWQARNLGEATLPRRLAAFLKDERRLRPTMERLAYEAHRLGQAAPDESGAADLPRKEAVFLLEQPEYLGDLALAGEFLDFIDQRSGLLTGQGGDLGQPTTYSFPHRTFQEYLAGCYILGLPDNVQALWERAGAGDYWAVAVQLGLEELYHRRRSENELFRLADMLCPAEAASTLQERRVRLWAGAIAGLLGAASLTGKYNQRPYRGAAYLTRQKTALVDLLDSDLPAPERAAAGDLLARLGDPRPGVGLNPETGLPDIDWCDVPAGAFLMGSDPQKDKRAQEDEQPQHTLTLPAYKISRYPVTNAHYRAFVEDGGYSDRWQHCWTATGWAWKQKEDRQGPETYGSPFNLANHPVVGVSWYEAVAFCRWLTERLREVGQIGANEVVRLPTEAEWEKAARGTEGRIYPWGDAWDSNLANARETGLNSSSAVGCFPGGASPYHCQDMSGNVYEWCSTVWNEDAYPYQINDEWSMSYLDRTNVRRVLRGGSWVGDDSGYFRVSYRFRSSPDYGGFNGGCRLALSS